MSRSAPLPPWRSVPDVSTNDDTQVDRAPAAALLRARSCKPPVAPVVQPPVARCRRVRRLTPSMAPVDVSFDRPSVAVPSLPREDAEIRVRATVAEAVAPLNQTIRELLRRIEELERRPVPQPAAAVSVAAAPPAVATTRRGLSTAAAVLSRRHQRTGCAPVGARCHRPRARARYRGDRARRSHRRGLRAGRAPASSQGGHHVRPASRRRLRRPLRGPREQLHATPVTSALGARRDVKVASKLLSS